MKLAPLKALRPGDMPPRLHSFWRLTGPSAVLVGLSIGAGEIVVWPRTVAQFGAGMVWAAVLGVLVQLVVNVEIARWTLATGESVYTGFSRLSRLLGLSFIFFNVAGWLAPGWAWTSGLALKALLVGPGGYGGGAFWTAVTFGIVALMIFGPRSVYGMVEKSISLMVVVVTGGLILVAWRVGTSETWSELLSGVLNIGYKHPDFPPKALFIAFVFAGAGGTANLFYSLYLRDKGVGMAASNPGSRVEGFKFRDNPKNAGRFRDWFGYALKDQALFFWFLNTLTMLLFIIGALAVLRPRGLVPATNTLIYDEAQILAEIWGPFGRTLFLVIGVATLFSTQLAILEGASRSVAEIIHANFEAARSRPLLWWRRRAALAWMIVGWALVYVFGESGSTELGFLFNAAYMGGFAMAVYVPSLLVMNLRFLPPSARPGLFSKAAAGLAGIIYAAFALFCLWSEITA